MLIHVRGTGRKITVGDPRDSTTWMGALISKQHEDKVRAYLKIAKDQGLKFCCGETVDQLALSAANQKVALSLVHMQWAYLKF